jgi:stage II sporulation protein AB (anti-sigma F factor)
MTVHIQSKGENAGLARAMVAAFASQEEGATINDLEELKIAVSEAVSNSIIHGYGNREDQTIVLRAGLVNGGVHVSVEDTGIGIDDIAKAMEPSYSRDPERMGLGFAFMKSFTDELEVESTPGCGVVVRMVKYFSQNSQDQQ